MRGDGSVDPTKAGSYQISFSYTDTNGQVYTANATQVVDPAAATGSKPTITVSGPTSVTVNVGQNIPWPDVSTQAGCSLVETGGQDGQGNVESDTPGTWTVTYISKDETSGLESDPVNITVTVNAEVSTFTFTVPPYTPDLTVIQTATVGTLAQVTSDANTAVDEWASGTATSALNSWYQEKEAGIDPEADPAAQQALDTASAAGSTAIAQAAAGFHSDINVASASRDAELSKGSQAASSASQDADSQVQIAAQAANDATAAASDAQSAANSVDGGVLTQNEISQIQQDLLNAQSALQKATDANTAVQADLSAVAGSEYENGVSSDVDQIGGSINSINSSISSINLLLNSNGVASTKTSADAVADANSQQYTADTALTSAYTAMSAYNSSQKSADDTTAVLASLTTALNSAQGASSAIASDAAIATGSDADTVSGAADKVNNSDIPQIQEMITSVGGTTVSPQASAAASANAQRAAAAAENSQQTADADFATASQASNNSSLTDSGRATIIATSLASANQALRDTQGYVQTIITNSPNATVASDKQDVADALTRANAALDGIQADINLITHFQTPSTGNYQTAWVISSGDPSTWQSVSVTTTDGQYYQSSDGTSYTLGQITLVNPTIGNTLSPNGGAPGVGTNLTWGETVQSLTGLGATLSADGKTVSFPDGTSYTYDDFMAGTKLPNINDSGSGASLPPGVPAGSTANTDGTYTAVDKTVYVPTGSGSFAPQSVARGTVGNSRVTVDPTTVKADINNGLVGAVSINGSQPQNFEVLPDGSVWNSSGVEIWDPANPTASTNTISAQEAATINTLLSRAATLKAAPPASTYVPPGSPTYQYDATNYSGVATPPGSVSVSSDGTSKTGTVTVTDIAGNNVPITVQITGGKVIDVATNKDITANFSTSALSDLLASFSNAKTSQPGTSTVTLVNQTSGNNQTINIGDTVQVTITGPAGAPVYAEENGVTNLMGYIGQDPANPGVLVVTKTVSSTDPSGQWNETWTVGSGSTQQKAGNLQFKVVSAPVTVQAANPQNLYYSGVLEDPTLRSEYITAMGSYSSYTVTPQDNGGLIITLKDANGKTVGTPQPFNSAAEFYTWLSNNSNNFVQGTLDPSLLPMLTAANDARSNVDVQTATNLPSYALTQLPIVPAPTSVYVADPSGKTVGGVMAFSLSTQDEASLFRQMFPGSTITTTVDNSYFHTVVPTDSPYNTYVLQLPSGQQLNVGSLNYLYTHGGLDYLATQPGFSMSTALAVVANNPVAGSSQNSNGATLTFLDINQPGSVLFAATDNWQISINNAAPNSPVFVDGGIFGQPGQQMQLPGGTDAQGNYSYTLTSGFSKAEAGNWQVSVYVGNQQVGNTLNFTVQTGGTATGSQASRTMVSADGTNIGSSTTLTTAAGSSVNATMSFVNLTSGDSKNFLPNDQWQITVTGPAGATVTGSINGKSGSQNWTIPGTPGTTGTLTIPGQYGVADVGNYTETWNITSGGKTSSIGQLAFSVQKNSTTAPAITKLSATTATAGQTLTLTGNNFNPVPSQNIIEFISSSGAVVATANATAISGNTLTFTVPGSLAYLTQTYSVAVVNGTDASLISGNLQLSITATSKLVASPKIAAAGVSGAGAAAGAKAASLSRSFLTNTASATGTGLATGDGGSGVGAGTGLGNAEGDGSVMIDNGGSGTGIGLGAVEGDSGVVADTGNSGTGSGAGAGAGLGAVEGDGSIVSDITGSGTGTGTGTGLGAVEGDSGVVADTGNNGTGSGSGTGGNIGGGLGSVEGDGNIVADAGSGSSNSGIGSNNLGIEGGSNEVSDTGGNLTLSQLQKNNTGGGTGSTGGLGAVEGDSGVVVDTGGSGSASGSGTGAGLGSVEGDGSVVSDVAGSGTGTGAGTGLGAIEGDSGVVADGGNSGTVSGSGTTGGGLGAVEGDGTVVSETTTGSVSGAGTVGGIGAVESDNGVVLDSGGGISAQSNSVVLADLSAQPNNFQGLQMPAGFQASGDNLKVPVNPQAQVQGAAIVSTATTYTIKKGDTLWSIAKQFTGDGRNWRKILSANPDSLATPGNTKTLKVGFELNIPAISASAQAAGTAVSQIKANTSPVAKSPASTSTNKVAVAARTAPLLATAAGTNSGNANQYPIDQGVVSDSSVGSQGQLSQSGGTITGSPGIGDVEAD
ncbi:MAG: LysM peptidoglycan-binding domain-containing protein [Candidatus Doudnabacteria bacterium]|nr:LysM peptidoglycan-binding domain-containing protein [Candidatus Doudnabacteria bacterium]